jgi:CspA family cold shock protein
MVEGRCLWFIEEEGFGVVVIDDAPGEVWLHYSNIEGSGYRALVPGERVRFEWEEPRGGQDGYRYRATTVIADGTP